MFGYSTGIPYICTRVQTDVESTVPQTISSVRCILRHSLPHFPTSTLSEFFFRYLGVPLTFAGSSWQLQYWQISHMSDGTSWENSPCGSGSIHFDYCPSSLLKYTNRAIKLAVTRVRWNTVHVAVGAQHVSKCSLK